MVTVNLTQGIKALKPQATKRILQLISVDVPLTVRVSELADNGEVTSISISNCKSAAIDFLLQHTDFSVYGDKLEAGVTVEGEIYFIQGKKTQSYEVMETFPLLVQAQKLLL